MTSESLRTLLDFGIDIAWQAGRITLEYYQTGVVPETKADASPVTIADRRAEEFLRKMIAERYPSHGILGEEYGETNLGASHRWILDPIDGTKSFVHGVPLYGVLVGLEREGEPVLGVINHPALDELTAAATGLGCTINGRRARVSTTGMLSDALLNCSDLADLQARAPRAYARLVQTVKYARTWGDCYAYTLIASGRAEIALDPRMNVWDNAPLLPILEEAGGRFTDWAGQATIHASNAVATNGLLHEAVLEILREP
jgi:histidinol phosphatase-like enzyme (inositol monophosphatase family)